MFNKNLTNVKQLLANDYSLEDALTLCNYDASEKEAIELKLKSFIIFMNKNKANKQNDVVINIL